MGNAGATVPTYQSHCRQTEWFIGKWTVTLGPSEAFRAAMDYYAQGPDSRRHLVRLSETRPAILACMHGSAWHGDGGALLLALADRVAPAWPPTTSIGAGK